MLLPVFTQAQFTYVIDQSLAVTDINGNILTMPWVGGLNATQYNTMDLDQDNDDDLVLFDRMADKVITILNQDGQFTYAPQYENFFPEDVTNWLILRDYNNDGRKDLFTSDFLGIKVYTNISTTGGAPAWKQFFFFSGFPNEPKQPVLLTKGFTQKVNLQLQFDDLPAIVDADGDGDLDIFNMRFVGTGTVEFHRNLTKEKYNTYDSLDYERVTQAWGNFRECGCGVIALNGEDCSTAGRTKHAGGKSLLVLDADGDQKLDLIISEAECTQMYGVKNEGTILNPIVNSYAAFPPSRPVNLVMYPAAYHEDVDFDGKKDLLFSPNIFTKEFLNTNLESSNFFYKNTGSTESPAFTFVKSDFLQDQMIDVGDNSVPAFVDYDSDGDYDMFISRHSSKDFRSTILFYENSGTADAPAFKLVNENFIFFSEPDFYNLKIQFVDMDANNTTDLVFTATSLINGVTDLYTVFNKSQDGFDFSGQPLNNLDFSLTQNENLYFTDVDADGMIDVLAGRGNGSLQYWRNTGLPTQFQFTKMDDDFLGLGSSVLRQNIACTVADLDADGKLDLAYGDQSGVLKIISDYRNAPDNTEPISNIVFNPLITGSYPYTAQNLGGRIWPTAVNLYSETNPVIVTGNTLGGLSILRHDEGQSLPNNPVIDIFPNPVDHTKTLTVKIDRAAVVQVLSVLGQQLSEPFRVQPHQSYRYKLPSLSAGVYLLRFTLNEKSYVKRIVIY